MTEQELKDSNLIQITLTGNDPPEELKKLREFARRYDKAGDKRPFLVVGNNDLIPRIIKLWDQVGLQSIEYDAFLDWKNFDYATFRAYGRTIVLEIQK